MYALKIPNGEYLRLRAAIWGNEIYYRLEAGEAFRRYPIFAVSNKEAADNVSRFSEVVPVMNNEFLFKIVNPFWEVCKVVEMREA